MTTPNEARPEWEPVACRFRIKDQDAPWIGTCEEETLPCPFCGSTNISDGEILAVEENIGHYSQSECQNCGAIGPRATLAKGELDYGDTKAIAAWNLRAKATP